MLYFCLWHNRNTRTKLKLSALIAGQMREGFAPVHEPDLGSKSNAHTGEMWHMKNMKGSGSWWLRTGEVTLGLALVYTTHTLSLSNQCWTLPLEGEQKKVTHFKSFFLFFECIFEISFLITQSLQVSGTILHVKHSGLEVLCFSKTKREERKRQPKKLKGTIEWSEKYLRSLSLKWRSTFP